jgi:poly(3-hydroxybutyrate) depolymerase
MPRRGGESGWSANCGAIRCRDAPLPLRRLSGMVRTMARFHPDQGSVGSVCFRLRPRMLPSRVNALSLLLCLSACSSESGDAPSEPAGTGPVEGGAGGDRSATAGSPGADSAPGASMNPEAQDPSQLGNVTPEGVTPGPAMPGGESGSSDSPEAAPVPSAGCGALALVSSGEGSIEVEGVTRSYLLDVPSGYDGTTPLPIVFAFHGATTSGELFRSRFYGNLPSTMSDAAILVHPDALGDPTAWDNQVDVPFFDALLASLEATACVDQARVFATGHSSGGFFTNTLGCQRGDVLRAIAPVSAGGPFAFGANGCRGEVAVWLAHAENDETVSFDLGVASRDRWLEANGCSEMSAAVEPAPCLEYAGCSSGLPVRWCVYDDGHNWPEFGPEGIWGFFSSL